MTERIILEATESRFLAGGTPVRLWHGVTEAGAPLLAVVVCVAIEEHSPVDPKLEATRRPPVGDFGCSGKAVLRGPDGTVVSGRWWV